MAPFSESRNFRGWWNSKTSLEQKLIIFTTLLSILCFCLIITVIVLDNRKCSAGSVTTAAPTNETTTAPTEPTEPKPTEPKPTEPKPTETEPTETKPPETTTPKPATTPSKSKNEDYEDEVAPPA